MVSRHSIRSSVYPYSSYSSYKTLIEGDGGVGGGFIYIEKRGGNKIKFQIFSLSLLLTLFLLFTISISDTYRRGGVGGKKEIKLEVWKERDKVRSLERKR